MINCNCEFVVDDVNSTNWEAHYNTCNVILTQREKNGEFPNGRPRSADGTLLCINKNLNKISGDYLYHLDLGVSTHDLRALFGDVKFVCMGGTAKRVLDCAKFIGKEIGCHLPVGTDLIDITASSLRYSMYKIGPVLTVNHGIGISTMSVVLQEVIKLLRYSGSKDPIVFRIGTSGGIGIEPGSVVVSEKGFNGLQKNTYDLDILGKTVSMPAILDKRLAQELASLSTDDDDFKTLIGNTMCANDFYNGQGRTDGPFCEYTEEDKFEFLKKLQSHGIKNIEMEVTCFSALTYKAGIKAADVCVTLLDRLKGDQVTMPKNLKHSLEIRPIIIVTRYIQKYLKKHGKLPFGKC
ncbi:uridine phosphorylase 1-like [Arctopsyche grandis]|uniref:uridine phosphorylase 1-like n=1 Tax=Arctopsyche grandis TaxID=121162 RepID=UPI00406D7A16